MIEVEHLTVTYGGFTAVHDVTFTAASGRVTGFLGPNGAGKSTTMRVMTGLTRPSAGQATIDGRRFADLPNPGREVGVLLDASAQHAGRTGREILTVAQQTMGLPARRVDEMLERVSLTPPESKRRVRNYSLGMRQRLGIATALLGGPRVLILDEPANGLDPAGIRWMRDLLRGFADQGGTVLLSSHLLHEIEAIADDLVVIGNGRIVAQGAKSDLLEAAGTLVRTERPDHVGRRARTPPTTPPRPAGGAALRTDATTDTVGRIALAGGHRPDRAARRRGRRPRGDVPRAHRRHPTRRSSGMTATHPRHRRGTVTQTSPGPATARQSPGVRPHPPVAGDGGRAAQDVRHPLRLLDDGQHRHPVGARHRRGDPLRPRRRADLRELRRRDRLPDGRWCCR